MSATFQSVPPFAGPVAWFGAFVKEELAPYPGRMALVARMVLASTLVMIIGMTFRLPEAAYAGIFALTISRESPQVTVSAVKTVAVAFVLAAAYELIGAMFFLNDPTVRLVWVIVTFFFMFYALSACTNYTAAVRFGYLVIVTTPLWDGFVSAEAKVEGTLWAVWTITLASVITALLEVGFAKVNRGVDILRPIAERLNRVHDMLMCYAENRPVDQAIEKSITRLAMVGISRLRRNLQRSGYSSQYREQMGAVLALVSRVVDIAASATPPGLQLSDADRKRVRDLAKQIVEIRIDLEHGIHPRKGDAHGETEFTSAVPLFREMETTVSLIPEVFSGSELPTTSARPIPGDARRVTLFRSDALSNSEHIRFGLKGCFAASLCYVIYNLLDWPGISTAVTTCFLTALTTIGSSHQKQALRFSGALVGGVVLGLGAQVFILPYIDSIGGFTTLFVVVTFAAAWVATSSARISYFGFQLAVAFYLLNLTEFKFQTSLAVARDRIVGILLGLLMMWLVFDQLWGAPAAIQMKRSFIAILRSLAQYVREPLIADRSAMERSYLVRETINDGFDKVRSLADAVLLEFGPSRHQNLALRDQIRRWQPHLRLIFLTRIMLLKYRFNVPGFELPEPVAAIQRQFDDEIAKTLDSMADRLTGKATGVTRNFENFLQRLEQTIDDSRTEPLQTTARTNVETFIALSRRMGSLTDALAKEI